MSRTLQADTLVVRNIQISAVANNVYPSANTLLVADGYGGTVWSSLSSFSRLAYNAIQGDVVYYGASNLDNTFTLKSGSGIGQVGGSTNTQTITLFSKSIQGITTAGSEPVYSFANDYLNPVMNFSTAYGLNIETFPQGNTVLFSLSSVQNSGASTTTSYFTSTVAGLGSIGYLSSILTDSNLASISTAVSFTGSTVSSIIRPTVERIVTSTIVGLASFGYISSLGVFQVVSTSISLGLSSVYNGITSNVIPSTVNGLGTLGYFSDIRGYSNTSSVIGPAISTVFSTLSTQQGIFSRISFPSTIAGLGSLGYVSTLSDFSTIRTSTIIFEDYTTREKHRLYTSSTRLYFNSTIVTGIPTLALQTFVL